MGNTPDAAGLRFPTVRTLKTQDLLDVYDGIIDDAKDVLKDSQIAGLLPIPKIPEGVEAYIQRAEHNDPLPPDDMTMVPSHVLGQLFSLFQNHTNYVASEVTRAKCVKEIQERKRRVIEAALTLYYREEEGVPANALDDKVTCDARYVATDAALLRVRVFYETAKSREEQLRRTLNNISREQTRRGEELERQLHDEHGGNGPPTQPSRPGGINSDSPFKTRSGFRR